MSSKKAAPPKTHQAVEYKYVTGSIHFIEAELNALGKDGWEVTSFSYSGAYNDNYRAVMKRIQHGN